MPFYGISTRSFHQTPGSDRQVASTKSEAHNVCVCAAFSLSVRRNVRSGSFTAGFYPSHTLHPVTIAFSCSAQYLHRFEYVRLCCCGLCRSILSLHPPPQPHRTHTHTLGECMCTRQHTECTQKIRQFPRQPITQDAMKT